EDHVRSQRDQFFREQLHLIGSVGRRKAVIDADIAALGPSTPFQPLPKACKPCLVFQIFFGEASQHADVSLLIALLRAQRHGPSGYTAAKKRDELPSPHGLTQSQGSQTKL